MINPTSFAVERPRSFQSPQQRLHLSSASKAMPEGATMNENIVGIDEETLSLPQHNYLPYSSLETYPDFPRHS